MKNNLKKAQAEIIVTVLIILLVLAAIVIVWQVVQNTVTQGAGEIPGQTECLTTKLDILSAVNYTSNILTLTLKRGVGQGSLIGVAVVIDGVKSGNINFNKPSNLTELEQKAYNFSGTGIKPGSNVKIAKLIGSDINNARLCDFTDNSIEGILITSA